MSEKVWIEWTEHGPESTTEYEFDTLVELNAFLRGLEEAHEFCGLEFTQHDQDPRPPYPKQIRLTKDVRDKSGDDPDLFIPAGTILEVIPLEERLSAYSGPGDDHEVRIPAGFHSAGTVIPVCPDEYELVD